MVQFQNLERCLAWLYTICSVASLLQIICSAILWLHWRQTLNTCAGNFQSYSNYYDQRDCGCIFFATDTLTYFVGSDVGYCYWGTFGLVISLLFSLVFGSYHVFRACCKTQHPRTGKMHVRQRSTEIMQLTIEQELQQLDDISPYFWTPATIIAFIMLIYTTVHSSMLTAGFLTTCKQYRNRVIKHILAKGDMVGVVQSRLSCGAIFDFMDYLQEDLSYERRRDYRINTAYPFILAVLAAWVVVVCWLGILVINTYRFRQSRRIRV